MKNTITVIIPFFNSEKTLSIMLDSILSGSTVPSEILLIDDGSTDSSKDVANKYSSMHAFIKYFYQDHQGVSAARNLGLSIASGEWISFLDADDYIEPDMFRLMSDSLTDDSYSGCVCGYYTHKDDVITPYFNNHKASMTSNKILEAMFADDNVRGFLFTRLFRADIIKDMTFDNEISICEDLLFQSQLFSSKKLKFACVNKPLYHYIQNSTSVTASVDYYKNNSFVYKPAFDKILGILNEDYVNTAYNSILEYSMYSLLKEYKASNHDKKIKCQIRKLQKDLKVTPCLRKSRRRIIYQYAPIIYGSLFI